MSKKTLLFYEGEVVQEFEPGLISLRQYTLSNWGLRIYNEGYVYWPSNPYRGSLWYRCDLTPVLLQDVPKEYRVLALLMTE